MDEFNSNDLINKVIPSKNDKEISTEQISLSREELLEILNKQVSPEFLKLITTGENQSYINPKQNHLRSERDQSVVNYLVLKGLKKYVYSIFETFPIGDKYLEKKTSKKSYLDLSIKKAEQYTGVSSDIMIEIFNRIECDSELILRLKINDILKVLVKIDNNYWVKFLLNRLAFKTTISSKELEHRLNEIKRDIRPVIVSSAKDLLKREIPPIEYLAKNFLVKNANTQYFSDSGTGKSISLLAALLQINDSQYVFGHFQPSEKLKILWYDSDQNGIDEFTRRLQYCVKGLKINPDSVNIEYRGKFGNIETELKYIKENNFDLIILDSFLGAYRYDENSSSDMEIFFENLYFKLKDMGISSITLDHSKKGTSENIIHKSRGSSNKGAKFDSVWKLTKNTETEVIDEEKQIRSFDVSFESGKDRSGATVKEFSIKIIKNLVNQETRIEYLGNFNINKKNTEDVSAKSKILEYLEGKGILSTKEISDNLEGQYGFNQSTITKALNILVNDRLLIRPRHGHYQIKVKGPEKDPSYLNSSQTTLKTESKENNDR